MEWLQYANIYAKHLISIISTNPLTALCGKEITISVFEVKKCIQ